MTEARAIAEKLSEAAREALLGAHRLSDFTDERAVFHRCPQEVCDELWNAGLIKGARFVSPLGLEVRRHLIGAA